MWTWALIFWAASGDDDLLAETLSAHRAARDAISTVSCRVLLDCKYVNGAGKFIHRQDDARWWYGPQFIRYRAKRFLSGDYEDVIWVDGMRKRVVHYAAERAALPGEMVSAGSGSCGWESMHIELHDPFRCTLFVINVPLTLECYLLEDYVKRATKVRRVRREKVEGRDCVVIDLYFAKKPGTLVSRDAEVRLFLDADYNYLIWREVFKLDGELQRESEVVEFAEPSPGVFFPVRYKHMNTPKGNTEHRIAEIKELRINEPIPAEIREMVFPHGVRYIDVDKRESYRVDERGRMIGTHSTKLSNTPPPPPEVQFPPGQRHVLPGSLEPSATEAGSVWPWTAGISLAIIAAALGFRLFAWWRWAEGSLPWRCAMQRGRPLLTFFGFLGAAMGAGWCLNAALMPGVAAPPRLVAPHLIHLGTQQAHTRVTAPFTLENQGGAPLVIHQIQTQCACSGLEEEVNGVPQRLEHLVLAPGEKRRVQTRLVVSPRPQTQEYQQSLVLHTNDPKQPQAEVIFHIRYEISTLLARPGSVAAGSVPLGQPRRFLVELRDESSTPRRLRSVASGDPGHYQVRLLPPPETAPLSVSQRRNWSGQVLGSVEVTILASKRGEFDAEADVYVEGQTEPAYRLRVFGRVLAPIEFGPQEVRLPRRGQGGYVWSARFTVRSSLGGVDLVPMQLPPDLSVTISGTAQDAVRHVEVTWHPERAAPPRTAERLEIELRAQAGEATDVLKLPILLRPPEAH